MLMLRNLVTSLFEHEQIKTTLPKARDTARLAEKIITMGKKGGLSSYQRANGFLLKPQLTPKVFGTFAKRYADREGGYTRIHKYGNRPGDNAPHAILELVDNPRDIKFEMTARAIGWEVLSKKLGTTGPRELVNSGVGGVESIVSQEQQLGPKDRGHLRPTTRWNLQKVLRFRNPESVSILGKKAEDHIDTLLAQPVALKQLLDVNSEKSESADETPLVGPKALRIRAGQKLPGGNQSTLRLAQGALGKEPSSRPRWFERRKLGIDRSALWGQL
ncbi:hypothetical protein NLI96_g1360 [Meripilus lineatus]|uniref:Mitochondrial ribosomal protein L17 n=1 Tax=Meripilus lineatus TaxID=2056292 RepID=A0AAD5VAJ5_9APHY|nr:hypothetical protein NLI96_g1360 [Physisporinus lineatus]